MKSKLFFSFLLVSALSLLCLSGELNSQNTRPKLLLGDSISQGWFELGEKFHTSEYIEMLRKSGFNSFMIWSHIGVVKPEADKRVGFCPKIIWPWQESTGKCQPPYSFNLKKQNEKYFERLKTLLVHSRENHLKPQITIFDGWTKTRFPGHPFNIRNGGFLKSNKEYVKFNGKKGEFIYHKSFDAIDPSLRYQWVQEKFIVSLTFLTQRNDEVIWDLFNEGEWYNQEDLISFVEHFALLLKSLKQTHIVVPREIYIHSETLREIASAVSVHTPRWDKHKSVKDLVSELVSDIEDVPMYMNEPVPEFFGDRSAEMLRFAFAHLISGRSFWLANDSMWKYQGENTTPIMKELGKLYSMIEYYAYAPLKIEEESVCRKKSEKDFVCYFRETTQIEASDHCSTIELHALDGISEDQIVMCRS